MNRTQNSPKRRDKKNSFLLVVTLKSYAGDWPTVTGCPVSNPGNNCANGLFWLSGAYQRALLAYWAVNRDDCKLFFEFFFKRTKVLKLHSQKAKKDYPFAESLNEKADSTTLRKSDDCKPMKNQARSYQLFFIFAKKKTAFFDSRLLQNANLPSNRYENAAFRVSTHAVRVCCSALFPNKKNPFLRVFLKEISLGIVAPTVDGRLNFLFNLV